MTGRAAAGSAYHWCTHLEDRTLNRQRSALAGPQLLPFPESRTTFVLQLALHRHCTAAATWKGDMKTIQGPGIFLAQFASDTPPFNSFDSICAWAAGLGYVAVQIPTWDRRLFDLQRAAESSAYCDDLRAIAAHHKL